ncbi:muscarinic acetylcholine receptor M3 [Clarias gariepinus]|uniref:muscarinic acetylcholine receptor M3 n=1 Tax=Clarias gariepinus TaxID=13013 RepID=UPI00234E25F4|nr:muscarinic acetylcholine receptor M3 [Clarias gariepinus]
MNLTLSSKPGFFLTNSSPGMRDYPGIAVIPQDLLPEGDAHQANVSLLTRGANLTSSLNATVTPTVVYDPLGGHSVWQVIIIVLLTGSLSLVTIIGNVLVVVSFKVNKQLKTVNNYYLLSLAFADLIIGILSMNLYTTYIIMGRWSLGNWACDLWLAIDYVASNASVMNLLVISFDRYFSVTRPLTYRAKRTTKRAMTMIGLAWFISFVLWAPAILFWQYFVGKRTVPPGECYIQFLSEPIITFCTAIAAFYLPVTIMTVLYWRIYKETENRSKDLAGLKGSGSQVKQSSEEESTAMMPSRDSSYSGVNYSLTQPVQTDSEKKKGNSYRFWLLGRSGQKVCSPGDQEHSSSDSWNNNDGGASIDQSDEEQDEEGANARAIYSIAVDMPETRTDGNSGTSKQGQLKPENLAAERPSRKSSSKSPNLSLPSVDNPKPCGSSSASKSPSVPPSFKDETMTKDLVSTAKTQANKRKKVSLVKEKKAAQTLSAILLAFIITWTPYNIMVLVNTFCNDCIPVGLWALGYWLCYVNSTVNPMCYALCNKNFRITFKTILLCQWDRQKQNKPHLQQNPAVVAYRKKELM